MTTKLSMTEEEEDELEEAWLRSELESMTEEEKALVKGTTDERRPE